MAQALWRQVCILATLCLVVMLACVNNVRAAGVAPVLTQPANNATYSVTLQQFRWTTDRTDIVDFALTLGSTEGARDLYDSGSLGEDAREHVVNGIGTFNSAIYIQLWYKDSNGLLSYSPSVAYAENTANVPRIFAPAAHTTLDSNSLNLQWQDNGANVNYYWLYAGSSPGSNELANTYLGQNEQFTLEDLPTNGSKIWVRLYNNTGTWRYTDYEYTANSNDVADTATDTPELISPTQTTVLAHSPVQFIWRDNDYQPENYRLSIGTQVGGNDIYETRLAGSVNEHSVEQLPEGIDQIYVRLGYNAEENSDQFQFKDYRYSTQSYGGTQLVWPEPGTLLEGTSTQFQWTDNGQGVNEYRLLIGSTPGSKDFYDSGLLDNSVTSLELFNLNRIAEFLHTTLQYKIGNDWFEERYIYHSIDPQQGTFRDDFDNGIDNWTSTTSTWSNGNGDTLESNVSNDWTLSTYQQTSYRDFEFSALLRQDSKNNPSFLSIRNSGTVIENECWCEGDGCYTFEINARQEYAVWSCKGYDWVSLQDISFSEYINPGTDWNELRVVAEGPDLSFYINDGLVWQGNDETHVMGTVGVGTADFDAADNIFAVDWASVQELNAESQGYIFSNRAVGGLATQSSTSYGGIPDRAIDGNTDSTWAGRSVSRTSDEDQPWWQLDLRFESWLDHVNIYNRTDRYFEYLQDVYVFVSATDMRDRSLAELRDDPSVEHTFVGGSLGDKTTVDLSGYEGRFVRIQLAGAGVLTMGEVEIISASRNRLLSGTASQSSTLADWRWWLPQPEAILANDGNTDGDYDNNSVTQTNRERRPWWQIALDQRAIVETVRIYNRTDCCSNRLRNVHVFLSDTDMSTRSYAELYADAAVTHRYIDGRLDDITHVDFGSATGQFVRIQLAGRNNLSLAEVEVIGR